MSDDCSTNLALPYIIPGQAQKLITHNEGLQVLDALVQLSVVSRTQIAPPAAPSEGNRYIVPENAGDAWEGAEHSVASYTNGGWVFHSPQNGWRAWIESEGKEAFWNGSEWKGNGFADQTIETLGINATANSTNRLTVSAPATLLTNEGTGHQLKINKAGENDTSSVVFQNNYQGKAEVGLNGSDHFSIKVSGNGNTWIEALKIDSSTGLASGISVSQDHTDDTAGRLARIGDFGLGSPYVLGTEENLQSGNLHNGFYVYNAEDVDGGPENTNTPHALLSMHIPASTNNGNNARVFLSCQNGAQTNEGHIWLGHQTSDGQTIDWKPVYTSTSIVGTTSQQNNIPTGAVIEEGSNINGNYVRFADGTQICWHRLTSQTNAGKTWTFPQGFYMVPTVTGTAQATACAVVVEDSATTQTRATLSVRGTDDARRSDPMSLVATGRWF